LTQGLLRVALGYILSPPSEAESALAQLFRSSAFPANELPGYGFAGLGGGDSGSYEQSCTVLDSGTTLSGTYPQIQMS